MPSTPSQFPSGCHPPNGRARRNSTISMFNEQGHIRPTMLSRPISRCSQRPRQSRRLTRSEEHTSELQSRPHLVCRLLLEKKKEPVIFEERLLDNPYRRLRADLELPNGHFQRLSSKHDALGNPTPHDGQELYESQLARLRN